MQQILPQYLDIDALDEDDQRRIMACKSTPPEGAVERLLRRVFVHAIVTSSSDVHIEGHGDATSLQVQIFIRTPKKMQQICTFSGEAVDHFEVKMHSLTATPQGGSTGLAVSSRFSIQLPLQYASKYGLTCNSNFYDVDVRVEYIKTVDGFAFVARLQDQQRSPALDQLNLSFALLKTIKSCANEPSGLIITSGPTGSGKSTLMNALLRYLDNGQRSIVTIENPVEFKMRGNGPIKQIETKGTFGFAQGLRSTLRLILM